MAKFGIMLTLTESRYKEMTVEAETRKEAELVAQRAIDDAIQMNLHHLWETDGVEFRYDLYDVEVKT